MKKRKRREIPPLFPCPRGTGQRRAVYTVASGVTGRRCGHVGQELVLSGHLRAGAGTGDLHRCIFPVGFLMFLVALLLVVCGWGCIRRR